MLRSLLVGLCRLLLRIFFRRIEIVGAHHLPSEGSLLFALNHPSGLIDPLFILCLSGRRVSFLAKEPLFRMPVIGTFVKAFESLPVYRSRDGGDPKKNKEMMRAAADLLARGNALALFPEGTSHSDPSLKRFRSGAARIALSARALGGRAVRIVPAALYYERKQTFRSRAVLAFGAPLEVPLVTLDEFGDSPLPVGQQLTSELEKAIRGIMPTADSVEGLVLAEQAERVFSAALRDSPESCPKALELMSHIRQADGSLSLAERMARRQRLIDAYTGLVELDPERIEALTTKIRDLQAAMELSALPIDAPPRTPPYVAKKRPALAVGALALAPFAAAGALLHLPAYQLVRFIAFRYSADQADVTATVKLISGGLFFLVTWLALGGAAAWFAESPWGLLATLAGPASGWTALRFNELSGALRRSYALSRRASAARIDWARVTASRQQITEEMAELLRRT